LTFYILVNCVFLGIILVFTILIPLFLRVIYSKPTHSHLLFAKLSKIVNYYQNPQ
jgi:hypothetical protein